MGLVKKETIIKPTSSMTLDTVKTATRTMVNSYQNGATNKNTNGTFKDFFLFNTFFIKILFFSITLLILNILT